MTATPDGSSPNQAKGCSATGFDASIAGLGLAMLALIRRRR
jgi:uncharacterized protein (TIGR03382 family)